MAAVVGPPWPLREPPVAAAEVPVASAGGPRGRCGRSPMATEVPVAAAGGPPGTSYIHVAVVGGFLWPSWQVSWLPWCPWLLGQVLKPSAPSPPRV